MTARQVSIAGLVLAAGSSRRLGQPKQLLAYRGTTLLGATLDRVRGFGLDQLIVTLGGASPEVRTSVDLTGFDVVENTEHTTGCSSSIVAALDQVAPDRDGFLLFLGDQPAVPPEAVDGLVEVAAGASPGRASIGLCRYQDGLGHPFWFSRSLFTDLAAMHGDKAVWKLLESGRWPVVEVAVDTPVPLDVDTWQDYQQLLASHPS